MGGDHAKLSPSGSKRWMTCLGSPRMEAGMPDQTSEYAKEGTAAHSLGEMALKTSKPPEAFLDRVITVEGTDYTVDAPMVEAVTLYTDEVNRIMAENPGAILYIERKLKIPKGLTHGESIWGTGDATIELELEKVWVRDYKHGAGVAVDAVDNPQLRIYGLGASIGQCFEEVDMGIVQPRTRSGRQMSNEVMSYEDLYAWLTDHLAPAVKATLDLEAALTAGDHCQFCKAKALCPEMVRVTGEATKLRFTDIQKPIVTTDLPDVETMDLAHIQIVLQHQKVIEGWFKAVRDKVTKDLQEGRTVPGWKLVKGTATRSWVSEQGIYDHLTLNYDVPESLMMSEPKMLSVAQMEKAVRLHKDCTLKEAKALVAQFVNVKHGTVLAPEADKRKALEMAADRFGDL